MSALNLQRNFNFIQIPDIIEIECLFGATVSELGVLEVVLKSQ